jgi:hypothetical protein
MAVITDVGDPKDIHPKKKQPVGARLALAARGIAYGENIVFSGPIYKSMKVDGNKAILSFDHVEGGLEARDGALKGFAICGDDHKFVWATAEIEGHGSRSRVVVSAGSGASGRGEIWLGGLSGGEFLEPCRPARHTLPHR